MHIWLFVKTSILFIVNLFRFIIYRLEQSNNNDLDDIKSTISKCLFALITSWFLNKQMGTSMKLAALLT